MTAQKKKRRSEGWFFGLYRGLFIYGRYVLLDAPMALLLWLFWEQFHNQGATSTPDWFVYFYWSLLGLYIPVKEDVHRRFEAIRNRYGIIRPVLWIVLIMYFAWKQSRPESFYPVVPPLVVETAFITAGAWVIGKAIAPKRAIKRWMSVLEGWAHKFNSADGE